jgi:glutathione synthase/RimK-type ligase-like ATP-grasp enzyme
MTVNIFAHNPNSEGARALSEALNVRRIRHEGSTYRGAPGKIVINWGSSKLPDEIARSTIINPPAAVASVSDKLAFFRTCERAGAPRIPEFTTSREAVQAWLEAGAKVVVRTILNGHSGNGIQILEGAGVDIPNAPLYTKYVPKKEEWRIHVMRTPNELFVMDQQRKIRDPDYVGVPDWNVRSHANGFIFARNVAAPNADVLNQAIKALEVSGLDFGAVDVIWNQQNGAAYVLEINTAPGLEGTTITSYRDAFRKRLGVQ